MSRYANNNQRSINVAVSVCDTMLSKESHFREGTSANMSLTQVVSDRFMPEVGVLEVTLMKLLEDDDEEGKTEVQEFLKEERERLQQLATQNAASEQMTDAFITSLRSLKHQIASSADQENVSDNMDYEAMLVETLEKELSNLKSSKPVEEYDSYQTICKKLGVEVNKPKRQRGANDDDDDIEIEETQGNASQDVRCPITRDFMDDAVKNNVCNHIYSKKGIEQLMQQKPRGCKCPKAGCTNNNVTTSQLEPDMVMQITVKRARRNQQREQEKMSQGVAELVDSDEE